MTRAALRPAAESDVPALTALVHAAYAELGAQGLNFTAVDQDDRTTRYRTFAGSSWIVHDAGELIATATVSFPPGEVLRGLSAVARDPATAWLNQLAVHPARRGEGHARLLLDRCLEHACEVGATSIGLDTAAPASTLRLLYEHWGFGDREIIHWPGKTYDSVVMTRPL
ncbi:GNAT family N-acetyltransferase [Microcella daejeonensis]|uniref:GNAT family N-acetyltransferase n=1 Tax=Microcella daejeonensis TaxID=2994971 RepID=UPI00226E0543|nr:GNAT family N-acetyltransferase [Microcella daejeonensis]WAB85214.1 GNAT family N-acetyltransferase [Microcella daejeonensis]